MIRIIEDNIEFTKKCLRPILTKDGIYINLNFISSENDKRTDRLGLDIALSELEKDPKQNIVLYSFEQPQQLYLNNKFMSLMARPNVYFARLPGFLIEGLDGELDAPKFHNAALEIASRIEYNTDLRGRLLHNRQNRLDEVVEAAKKEFGFKGNDFEIIQQLIGYDAQTVEPKGILPGVFVDVDGTLVKNDRIDKGIVNLMIEYSKTKPVCVWTGGNRDTTTKRIGFPLECVFSELDSLVYTRIPILNKQTFAGYEPEIVIDDLPQADFEDEYKMKPRQYIKV